MQAGNSGLFVTFEGTEGAGKSTLIREIARQLIASGFSDSQICLTREPGGTPVAEQIRKTILEQKMSPWTELFLYEAARADHLEQTILPGLRRGQIVLCDRFSDSSLAYQAHARGLPWNTVKSVNKIATQGLRPDVTFLIDIDPAVGLTRALKRGDKNRFEAEGLVFQKKVRAGFLRARRERPGAWIVLRPAQKLPPQLARDAIEALEKRFGARLHRIKTGASRG